MKLITKNRTNYNHEINNLDDKNSIQIIAILNKPIYNAWGYQGREKSSATWDQLFGIMIGEYVLCGKNFARRAYTTYTGAMEKLSQLGSQNEVHVKHISAFDDLYDGKTRMIDGYLQGYEPVKLWSYCICDPF